MGRILKGIGKLVDGCMISQTALLRSTVMSLKNKIPKKQKIFFIRPLRHQMFGTDFKNRDEMSDDDAVRLFDATWDREISPAIADADFIEYAEALSLIPKTGQPYCKAGNNTHYRFKLANTVFVAQVTTSTQEHNQLWAVGAQNFDTRTVYATFDEQADRDAWSSLAARFQLSPEDFAKRVLTAHLRAFDGI